MDVKHANLVVIEQVDEVQLATMRSLSLMLEMTAFISSYDKIYNNKALYEVRSL